MRIVPRVSFKWNGWNVWLVGWVSSRILGDLFVEVLAGGLMITLSWPNQSKWLRKIRDAEAKNQKPRAKD